MTGSCMKPHFKRGWTASEVQISSDRRIVIIVLTHLSLKATHAVLNLSWQNLKTLLSNRMNGGSSSEFIIQHHARPLAPADYAA